MMTIVDQIKWSASSGFTDVIGMKDDSRNRVDECTVALLASASVFTAEEDHLHSGLSASPE